MKSFVSSIGFIAFFLIGTLLFSMAFGEKAAFWFLLLVLLGQVFVGWDELANLMGKVSKA